MRSEPDPQVAFDAFNALVASRNTMNQQQSEPAVENQEAGLMSSAGSALMGAVGAASDAMGISAAGRLIGDAMDAITPPIVKNVVAAMQPQSASNIPIQHDPLTVTEAAGALGRAAVSSFVDNLAGAAEIPVKVVQLSMAGMMGGDGGISQQAELLAQAPLLNPRDDFKFGMLPPRMGSMPALAAPNGLGNVMAFEDAPLTSRISPLVEKILVPPSTRPIPASQPEGGRLAMQAFQNYQQDVEAPYAVRR